MAKVLDLSLSEDHHAHSTFSDGSGSLEENLEAARDAGLTYLGFVDHVRADTRWLPAFSERLSQLAEGTHVRVSCGVEAKLLDLEGTLDLPCELAGIDRIVAADHQMPGARGPVRPADVHAALRAGHVAARRVVEDLVGATVAAMTRRDGLLVAHLFSILPKMGLSEDDVSDAQVTRLVEAASRSHALIEVSERWRCPSLRVVRAFFRAGVPVVASSDAHSPEAIGRFDYVASVFEALGSHAACAGAA